MNKQQEYFEKNVVPYRQKIRELESENNQLHRDKAMLNIKVEMLECENEKLQNEIKSLMEFSNMSPEDRKTILKRSESLNMVSGMFKAFSKLY